MKLFLKILIGLLIISSIIFGILSKYDWSISLLVAAALLFISYKIPHIGRVGDVQTPYLGTDEEKNQAKIMRESVRKKAIPNKSLLISLSIIIIAIIFISKGYQGIGGLLIFFTVVGFGLYINQFMSKP